MKNRNIQLTAVLFVVALALAAIVQAAPSPDGGPIRPPANEAPQPDGGPTSHYAPLIRTARQSLRMRIAR